MFKGLSAWFSSSVPARRKRLWKQHGGLEVKFDEAQFVFSEDCECDDTKRLYESEAYLNEHLAVFHGRYIQDCVKEEDVEKVVVGKYFLPPEEIQNMMKAQIHSPWETKSDTENSDVEQSDDENDVEHAVGIPSARSRRRNVNPQTPPASRNNVDAQTIIVSPGSFQKRQVPETDLHKTEFVHIDSLPKVTGCLKDFVPDKSMIIDLSVKNGKELLKQ